MNLAELTSLILIGHGASEPAEENWTRWNENWRERVYGWDTKRVALI